MDFGSSLNFAVEPEELFLHAKDWNEHSAREGKRTRDQYALITDADLAGLGSLEWLIAGHVPADALGMVYGKPGTAKSFLLLDWALHMQTARSEWNGFTVSPGDVVYVAAEGLKGYASRIDAWKEKHEWEGHTGLRFIPRAVNLADKKLISVVLSNIEQSGASPKLIVFDTFARCFGGGDDNSARETGVAIDTMDSLRVATGATVAIVHHSRRSDEGFRGSSALEGAMDFIVHLKRDNDRIAATCEKMKDGASFDPLAFDFGYLKNSRVLNQIEAGLPSPSRAGKWAPNDQKALNAILGVTGPLTYTEWQIASGVPGGSFNRHRQKLVDLGLVIERGDDTYEARNPTSAIISSAGAGGNADDDSGAASESL